MVRFERRLVEQSLASAPETFELLGRAPERTVTLGGRHLAAVPVEQPAGRQRPRRRQAARAAWPTSAISSG